jgi:hypothetical protein
MRKEQAQNTKRNKERGEEETLDHRNGNESKDKEKL